MTSAHGYKAKYDYVEVTVEQRADGWHLTLYDRRHAENVEHDEIFASADEAKEAALSVAQHHINVQHNDTLLSREVLKWQEC
ncbi:MAG TPA: hypothetical protein VMH28_12280 [Candidatus Acidoferrales bacterium]|nr:hypothetical protein [Candidatus Acidoferrales bacterium]